VLSLVLLVLLPMVATAAYLWLFAEDQYASTVGFTVRQEESASAGALAGGLAQFLGGAGSTGANARVLYEYIQSQELVAQLQKDLDLIGHYSRTWPRDPVFSIWPDATIEELTAFWLRMVRISYDEGSGLIEIEARALDPAFARAITERIVAESQAMINELNETARRDAMAWANADLEKAVAGLRAAREALTAFRATTQILDPTADIQGRMGILNSLQQQLAQAVVDLDLLTGDDPNDPRRRQMLRRIEVIRDRIAQERQSFAAQDVTVSETDYPTLLARYESLLVDQEVAEATYRAARAALDGARARAERQTLYLATYIRPTLAQKSEYPDRPVLTLLAGFFLLMLWSVLALVYYSLRDRG
jgi:capsular polysaccharide transport system permease protein